MVFNQLLWSIQSKVITKMQSEELKDLQELASNENVVTPDTKVFMNYFKEIERNYGLIKNFLAIRAERGPLAETSAIFQKGLYFEAFCQGVNKAVVDIDEALHKIEEYYLGMSSISMIQIHTEFVHIIDILTSLVAAVEKLKEGRYNGCKILDLCKHFINSESSDVKEVFLMIQLYCLKRFYMQVKYWLVHSELYDPHEEFFIMSYPAINSDAFSLPVGLSDPSTESLAIKYKINANNLPSLIPFSVAVKILFIVEALMMCQNSESKNQLEECVINSESIQSKISEIEKYRILDIRAFTNFIDELWSEVNCYIRRISDKYGNVTSELISMWEIYLLGRDELFQEFLLKGSHLLNADVSTVTARNLNVTLSDAVCHVYSTENFNLIDRFNFKLPNRRALLQGMTTWTVMFLDCNIKWPLRFLFTPEVINNYNRLFSFLLKLKKAQMDLSIAFKRLNSIPGHMLRMEFIELKVQLLSIVSNLQNYCLTYVIANEMNHLLTSVKTTTMFTDLQMSLHVFLTNVLDRLFLSNDFKFDESISAQEVAVIVPPLSLEVNRCFTKIFSLCDLFSKLIITEGNDNISSELSTIKNDLYEILNYLFELTNKVDSNANNPNCDSHQILSYLHDLMVCLDYNRFYHRELRVDKI